MNTTTSKFTFPAIAAADLVPSRSHSAYLWLDWESGSVSFSSRHESERGSTTFHEYHGHSRRYCVDGDKVRSLRAWFLAEIAPLAERVAAGYTRHWDGNNHVARFTDDAWAAKEQIDEMFESRTPW